MVAEALDTGLALLIPTLVRGLHERGHAITLIHSPNRTDPAALESLQGLGRVTTYPIRMARAVGIGDLGALFEVRSRLYAGGGPDVVHAHSSKAGALARLAALGGAGAKVYSPHAFVTASPDLGRGARTIYGAAERWLSGLCDRIICSSEQERRLALGLGIRPDKLAVVPSAIPPPTFSPGARSGFAFPDDAVVVGFIGRLAYQKAPEVFVRALAQAAAIDPRIHGVLVGDGDLEEALRALSDHLRLSGRLLFLGRRPSTEILPALDILAMPSRYEGFSLMPLEAAYAQLPLVCTPVGGVDEAVSAGETGLIVPIDDVDAMAAAIVKLAADPVMRAEFGRKARLGVEASSVSKMVGGYEQVYRNALSKTRSPGSSRSR